MPASPPLSEGGRLDLRSGTAAGVQTPAAIPCCHVSAMEWRHRCRQGGVIAKSVSTERAHQTTDREPGDDIRVGLERKEIEIYFLINSLISSADLFEKQR